MIGGWAGLFGAQVPNEPPTPEQREELEKKRPHTYKCACDSHWVAEGREPMACWACETLVTPECYHG